MIDRDRNALDEGDVVEDAASLLWLVRNDGIKRGDWLPIEKASEMRVVNSEPGLSREQRADLGFEPFALTYSKLPAVSPSPLSIVPALVTRNRVTA